MLELALRATLSLAFVIGLLWAIARVSSRRLRGPGQSLVQVVTRQPLGRGSSLAVVNVGDRVLVVGMTEHQVHLLTELDPADLGTVVDGEAAPALRAVKPVHVPKHALPVGNPTLTGSVLSPQTWKQAFAAASKRAGNAS